MRITIKGIQGESKESIFKAVQRSITFGLDRYAKRIREVKVSLRDENGPKGGKDTRCVLQVKLHPRGQMVVTKQSYCGEQAIARAVDVVRGMFTKRSTSHG